MKILLPLLAAAGLAGCAAVPQPAPDREPCANVSSEGWRAWIDAMPGPERPRLVVTGRATVPTGGWRLSLALGPTRESDPPVQEVVLRAEPPTGPATQAIVTHEVTGTFPALPRYGAVVVRCGSGVLAEISPIRHRLVGAQIFILRGSVR